MLGPSPFCGAESQPSDSFLNLPLTITQHTYRDHCRCADARLQSRHFSAQSVAILNRIQHSVKTSPACVPTDARALVANRWLGLYATGWVNNESSRLCPLSSFNLVSSGSLGYPLHIHHNLTGDHLVPPRLNVLCRLCPSSGLY